MRFPIAMVTSALLVVPAAAEWNTLVLDRGDIRSVMLMGVDDAEPKRQVAVICTTLDGKRTGDPVVTVAAPSSGQFTVRPGDAAEIVFTAGAQQWAFGGEVGENDTSSFGASAQHADGMAIAAAAGEQVVTVAAGDIGIEINIGSSGSAEASRQFAEACGSRI